MDKIKKVLVVGYFGNDPAIYTYATSFYNTFKLLGYDVEKFDYRKRYFCNLSLLSKVFFRRSQLIFFVKAEKINVKTIKLLKLKGKTFIVNFYPDNPFSFWNGNANASVLNAVPFYDYFLIWSKSLLPTLESAGCKNVYYFPFAYDQELFSQDGIPDQEKEFYDSEVCFIGTWEPTREKWLTELCRRMPHLKLAIWGNLWDEKLDKTSLLKSRLKGRAIYGRKMITAFRCSKIVLNFIRKQNYGAHNMRTFEVPASKSFLLTQRTAEQAEMLFKEGESVACFDDIDELIDKITFYLNNESARNQIKNQGCERAKNYTLQLVLKKFMNFFEKGGGNDACIKT